MREKFKLGFLPTRRVFFSKEESNREKFLIHEKLRALVPELEIVGLDGLNDEALLITEREALEAARRFRAAEVDAVFAPHCNFGSEGAVALAAREIGRPLLLWGPRDAAPEPDGSRLRDTQCGLFATGKVLRRFGVPFTYIVNSSPEDSIFERGFLNFLAAANVVKHFRGARIGQIGTRPRDFYSVIVNEGELLERFGIQTIPLDLSTLVREVRRVLAAPSQAWRAEAARFRATADFSACDDSTVERLAALKLAIDRWRTEEGLSAAAIQCWDSLQEELGICSCFVNAILAGEGFPLACEADIHGAISSLLLQSATLTPQPTFLADLTIRHPENDNAELLWHCGPFPPELAEGARRVERHFVLPSHAPGVCSWRLRGGEVSLIRFDGIGGEYSRFCGEGQIIDGPFNQGTYGYVEVEDWPLWEEKLVRGPYIHHIAGAYGSYAPVFAEACRYLDVAFDPATPDLAAIESRMRR